MCIRDTTMKESKSRHKSKAGFVQSMWRQCDFEFKEGKPEHKRENLQAVEIH